MEQVGAGKVDVRGSSLSVCVQDVRTKIMLAQNPAQSIDEVIARLTDIIDISRQESSRLGYFAALYRKVTASVKQGILGGRFEDGARMGRLDVNFANRYLEPHDLHRIGSAPPPSCQTAFVAAAHGRRRILQHLRSGIYT